MNTLRRTVALATTLMLAGCGNSLSGIYGKKGDVNFEFHSNGSVELDVIGPVQQGSYVVEGGKVKITNAGQTVVLAIDAQGCLDGGPMIGRLCKQ